MDVGRTPEPCLKFEVRKSKNLGLLVYGDLQLFVQQTFPPTNNPGPSFVTNEMDYWEVITALPPTLELAAPIGSDSSEGGKLAPLVSIMPRGIQGYTGFTVDLESLAAPDPIAYEKRLPTSIPSKWTIQRGAWRRQYRVDPMTDSSNVESLVWKGSTKVLGAVDDGTPKCNGNLKLQTVGSSQLLAAWKQRRDSSILGSLTIFEGAQERMSIEQIVASCLCVVISERITGVNLLGGLGKR